MKKALVWVLAVFITLAAAAVQRITGPSWPVRGKVSFAGRTVAYNLDRSAVNTRDHEVKVDVPDKDISGSLVWRRFPSDDLWTSRPMERRGDALTGNLPKLPIAGKMEYRVVLNKGNEVISLTGEKTVILRFRGRVPGWLLILHILVMLLAMLFSTRAGLAALHGREATRTLVFLTLALLFLGGFVLGPLVQKYSFGVLWTGFPGGIDLTDNKTLVAFLIWVGAAVAGRKGRTARGWVLAASIVTLVVYLIPHSLLGSEFKHPNPPK